MKADKNRVILYRDEEGNAEMSALFFDTTREEESPHGSTVKNFLTVHKESCGNHSVVDGVLSSQDSHLKSIVMFDTSLERAVSVISTRGNCKEFLYSSIEGKSSMFISEHIEVKLSHMLIEQTLGVSILEIAESLAGIHL